MIPISPDLAAVRAYAGDATHVALSLSLLADSHTPISVFRALAADGEDAFLLESVEGGETMARYSFVGADVRARMTFADGVATVVERGEARAVPYTDPLALVRARLADWRPWSPHALPRFPGGAVGYIGFDCVCDFEPRIALPEGAGAGFPAGALLFADAVAAYDHVLRRLVLVVHAPLDGDREAHYHAARDRLLNLVARLSEARMPERPWPLAADPRVAVGDALDVRPNRTRADMEAAVERAREAIAAGDAFQIVVSQRLTVEVEVEPLTLYRALRAVNPSPYMFLLRVGDRALVGASPEVLVRLEGDELLLRPIAGTRRRGATPEEDAALAADLLADEKELAEHRMLIDLGRNDLGRIAAPGTVRVADREHIERYAHVMHIVSDIHATLADGLDAFDVFRACFPAGTVSGAPTVRACELLAELEPDRRGPYAGAVGYFGADGSLDTCIAIRTLFVEPGAVHVQAGAGIVHDSVPANEHVECQNKARSALRALQIALQRSHPEAAR